MKLVINIIGVFAVVIMTILGVFLIPFFIWATEIGVLHILLFGVSSLFLVISILGYVIPIFRKKIVVDKFDYLRIILLYVSLSGLIPSFITCCKFNFDEFLVEGELLYNYNKKYYSKFGAFRMRADSKALDGYGEVFFIYFNRMDGKEFDDGERRERVEYKIYDAYGDIVKAGDFDFEYWEYPENSYSKRYEYAGDYYSGVYKIRKAAQKQEMKMIGLTIIR